MASDISNGNAYSDSMKVWSGLAKSHHHKKKENSILQDLTPSVLAFLCGNKLDLLPPLSNGSWSATTLDVAAAAQPFYLIVCHSNLMAAAAVIRFSKIYLRNLCS
ncbi:MAG: hypothetical protein NTV43_18120 [Methylococcales bacterium]|nr:hypothetical protein [Methylococcales bacterium]